MIEPLSKIELGVLHKKFLDIVGVKKNWGEYVAQEAHQNALRQVVEWIKGKRETPLGTDAYGYYIWEANLQELKKQAEVKE